MFSFFSNKPAQTIADSGERSSSISGPYCELKQLAALKIAAQKLCLPKVQRMSRAQQGLPRSPFRGRGMEFSEVRAYQAGDDVRSIDWRVTARRQSPHTKVFTEERERPVFIVCDQSQNQFFGSTTCFKSVKAAEAAALFAWMALHKSDRAGGLVFSSQQHDEVKPARSQKSILRLLKKISDYNQALRAQAEDGQFDLAKALKETQLLIKPGTLLVIISDFSCETSALSAALNRLRLHNDIILIQTTDPLDSALPEAGIYPVSNGQQSALLDTTRSELQQRYQSWASEQQEHLAQLARRYRAPLIKLDTADDSLSKLQCMLSTFA